MTREEARQTIKSAWRDIISELLPEAERRVNGETSYICPFCGHGNNGDGLTFIPAHKSGGGNTLKCQGCGWAGDIFDLYQQTREQETDYNTALKDLAAQMGITIDPYRPTAADDFRDHFTKAAQNAPQGRTEATRGAGGINTPPTAEHAQNGPERVTAATPDYTEYYKACRERLTDPRAAAYLQQRGISLETARAYWIGFDPEASPAKAPGAMGNEPRPFATPRIITPCSKSFYVGRAILPEEQYKKLNSPGNAYCFNGAALYDGTPVIFVTEGAFDALSIIEAGGTAIALNSTSNADSLVNRLKNRPTEAALILTLDSDEQGQKTTQKLKADLQEIGITFVEAGPAINGGHKDPNEAFTADRETFIAAVHEAQRTAERAREEHREQAIKEEAAREKRTGPEMVDLFLQAVTSTRFEPTPTGITELDNAIGGGLIRQQLVLLGAAPGAGKTALTQWLFEGMAKNGKPCIYLNLEMSREQMLARAISRTAAQNGKKISTATILQGYKWTQEEREAITKAAEIYKATIAPNMIYNPDEVTTDLDGILEYLESEAKIAKQAGERAPFVVLDYLQIISGNEREDDTATIKRAVASLKKFAIEHDTVVFAIIATNRMSNMRGDVTLESGRDTSALEYSADLQLGLAYTLCLPRNGKDGRAVKSLSTEDRKKVTLKITKARFGIAGTEIDLHFDGETMNFSPACTEFMGIAEQEETAKQRPKKIY